MTDEQREVETKPEPLNIHMSQSMLKDLIEHSVAAAMPPPKPDRAELFAALAEAQKSIKNAELDASAEVKMKSGGTYGYSYATLASVMDAVRGPLAENGLSIIQLTADPGEGRLGIRTILAHSSGQYIEDLITMSPDAWSPQAVGSCRSYMRRYAVVAIVGIAGAIDDDAETATADPSEYPRIDPAEAEAIYVKADELFGNKADDVISRMLRVVFTRGDMPPIEALGDIPEGHAQTAMNALQNQWDRENPKKPTPRAQAKPEKKPKQADKKPATDPDDDDVPT